MIHFAIIFNIILSLIFLITNDVPRAVYFLLLVLMLMVVKK